MNSKYFIKAGYVENVPVGCSTSASYWTTDLAQDSAKYQWDVYRIASDLALTERSQRILDVGCGPPHKLRAFPRLASRTITLIDAPAVRPFVEALLPDSEFVSVDLEQIDLDLMQRYDLVICADVIEHLTDPSSCLAFLLRHVSGKGFVVISTPERDVLRGPDANSPDNPWHIREWNRRELKSYLESAGFDVVRHNLVPKKRYRYVWRWFGALLSRIGRPPSWYSCQVAICRAAAKPAVGHPFPETGSHKNR